MARPGDPEALEAEIAALGCLGRAALKLRFLELRGVPLPKFMRRDLMMRAVAHALQEHVLGGLDRETQKRLDQLVPEGFVWNGELHRSLSRIARAITVTRWSGWVFL